ncbi:hypothetical protein G7B40_036460 [Aetokthonos hydrillicola Thurmond2011]|jgi:hypothetical protein|uniref:Uncharacterized protein n=1 Tax=Aetokthonos hydrillicola Thurmond2011 TaxID=2712845 RepID=A0AAP5IE77_9CYAN|nr:hypothetical protein [Aetokthonos hydrillicola]MBO3457950.1 hypothetical protein [Aetokthonos hydrillicola CCALA 1050]MBW4587440.1 hypothetical protein [Aetokthonos hydrillicola CCALA 1050]MDR9900008.1 hypothetical protein [Aetokthonos hydrillicola Thurmond2011]
MADTTTNEPTKLEFIQYHQPALKDGNYKITIQQKITTEQVNESFSITKTFSVSGERFNLNPTDIHAVFPPNDSLGDHSKVLPHIILNRSTLPWERQADNNSINIPWLALLLFEEGEVTEPKIITLEALQGINSTAKFPKVVLENGQLDDDKVTVIDVNKKILGKILPTKEDLAYLAHVRQGTDNQGNLVDDESALAVIICNRLPKKSARNTVHLVSIEGRYNDNGFNFQGAGDNDNIRLVSLKAWSFSCIDDKQSFQGLLANLNREPSTLRLPKIDNTEAEKYLSMGYVPLPHFLREGSKTFSWYHSPLTTGNNPTDNITLPIRVADELVRYNPNNGMFDISYASAWELGRLLALQSKNFSVSLYNWKRTHKQGQIIQNTENHLPFYNNQPNTELPDAIASWFTGLSLLKGVPFNYLIPDENLLPIESIRFFWIDPVWIECLLDGAFSIGRVTSSDHSHDSSHKANNNSPATNPHEIVTGFLLRSDVVAGWPGLIIDGYNKVIDNNSSISDQDKLPILRQDRLSANVLICLFKGEVKTLQIHLKPETLHFGLDFDSIKKTFSKQLKDLNGQQTNILLDNISWKNNDAATRTLDINQLAANIKAKLKTNSFTSAEFALEMIEGVDKVSFSINR